MNIKSIFAKSAFAALLACSTAVNATIMSVGDTATFSFASQTLFDWNDGTDSSGQNYRTVVRDVQTLNLDRFDASLGQLLDVNIWYTTDWSLSAMVYAYDSRTRALTASGAGRSVSNQAIRLVDPNREVERNHEVVRTNCRDTGGCTSYANESGGFNGAFDLSAFSLSDFIGTDALDFRIVRTLISDLTRCGYFDTCYERNNNNAWSGSLFVSYLYDDSPEPEVSVPVPEPSTLALLGLGLLGIGATRLGRKKA